MSYKTRDRSYKGEFELSGKKLRFDYTVYVEADIEDSFDTDNPWESSFEVMFKKFNAYYEEENEKGELVEKEETDQKTLEELKDLAKEWLADNV